MTTLLKLPLAAPPDSIRVLVEYYDKDERIAFKERLGKDILGGDSRELVVPTPDFCTYFLYYKLRRNVRGYGSHDEIAKVWQHALAEIDGQLEFSDASIRLLEHEGANRATSERFGEAIGLSVASQLHDFHEGDWMRIPETIKRKTLDFKRVVASDGHRFVLLEAKGAAVEDNQLKPSTISNHKKSIKVKKDAATKDEKAGSILHGTIGVLDDRPQSVARCWLVDPPADFEGDPLLFKLIVRLEYIARYISFLGQRSQLSSALWTRLATLRAVSQYRSLDGIALRAGADAAFPTEIYDQFGAHNSWFASKSVVSDGPAGGHVFPLSHEALLFIGIQERLVAFAVDQGFQSIVNYKFPTGTVMKSVDCVVPAGRFRNSFSRFIELPERLRRRNGAYVRFSLEGHLHYCKSGLVFGVLPIPEEWRTAE